MILYITHCIYMLCYIFIICYIIYDVLYNIYYICYTLLWAIYHISIYILNLCMRQNENLYKKGSEPSLLKDVHSSSTID